VRKTRKPAETYITCGYSVVDGTGTGTMVYRPGFSTPEPGIATALKTHGPVVDVRAISIGVREPLIPVLFERERLWLITLLAEGESVYTAFDDAQTALRDDMDAGNILPGAHPGRGPAETPIEAALEAFREETMA
jgi:hypothetical protein